MERDWRGCGGCCAHFLSARFLFPAGLWLYLAGSSLPCLTLIGSPNFGYRSVHRDLEAQIAIVTESRALQQQLHQVGWGRWDLPGGGGGIAGCQVPEGCLCRRLLPGAVQCQKEPASSRVSWWPVLRDTCRGAVLRSPGPCASSPELALALQGPPPTLHPGGHLLSLHGRRTLFSPACEYSAGSQPLPRLWTDCERG